MDLFDNQILNKFKLQNPILKKKACEHMWNFKIDHDLSFVHRFLAVKKSATTRLGVRYRGLLPYGSWIWLVI